MHLVDTDQFWGQMESNLVEIALAALQLVALAALVVLLILKTYKYIYIFQFFKLHIYIQGYNNNKIINYI